MITVFKQGKETFMNCMLYVKLSVKTKQFVKGATPFIEIIKNYDQKEGDIDPYLVLNKQDTIDLIEVLNNKLLELEEEYTDKQKIQ